MPGWYQIQERKRTTADEVGARADALIAEVKRGLEAEGRGRGQARPGRVAGLTDLPPDVVANVVAPGLGRSFGHSPERLAQALRLRVQIVPHEQLQNAARPNIDIRGRLVSLPGRAPFIQLSDRLAGRELLQTLAHEIAHHLLGNDASEANCNDFASRFLRLADDELGTPNRAKWAQWQQRAEERARADARNRALARRG